MWNTAIINYKGYTNFINLQTISESLFKSLLNYNVNEHKISKSSTKKIEKAKKQNNYENAIYELVKSNGISKTVFKRFLKQINDTKHNENGYYINYKYYDILIERLLDYVYIIDKNILNEVYSLTIKFTFNDSKTVTNIFIPIQKLAIDEIEEHKITVRKYSNYITYRLCMLNHRLNELNSRRVIL